MDCSSVVNKKMIDSFLSPNSRYAGCHTFSSRILIALICKYYSHSSKESVGIIYLIERLSLIIILLFNTFVNWRNLWLIIGVLILIRSRRGLLRSNIRILSLRFLYFVIRKLYFNFLILKWNRLYFLAFIWQETRVFNMIFFRITNCW